MKEIRGYKLLSIKQIGHGDVKYSTGNMVHNTVITLGTDNNETDHGDHLGMHRSVQSLS